MKKYILIDIGGTAIKYGVIDEMEQFLMQNTVPSETEKGGYNRRNIRVR